MPLPDPDPASVCERALLWEALEELLLLLLPPPLLAADEDAAPPDAAAAAAAAADSAILRLDAFFRHEDELLLELEDLALPTQREREGER